MSLRRFATHCAETSMGVTAAETRAVVSGPTTPASRQPGHRTTPLGWSAGYSTIGFGRPPGPQRLLHTERPAHSPCPCRSRWHWKSVDPCAEPHQAACRVRPPGAVRAVPPRKRLPLRVPSRGTRPPKTGRHHARTPGQRRRSAFPASPCHMPTTPVHRTPSGRPRGQRPLRRRPTQRKRSTDRSRCQASAIRPMNPLG